MHCPSSPVKFSFTFVSQNFGKRILHVLFQLWQEDPTQVSSPQDGARARDSAVLVALVVLNTVRSRGRSLFVCGLPGEKHGADMSLVFNTSVLFCQFCFSFVHCVFFFSSFGAKILNTKNSWTILGFCTLPIGLVLPSCYGPFNQHKWWLLIRVPFLVCSRQFVEDENEKSVTWWCCPLSRFHLVVAFCHYNVQEWFPVRG